MDLGDLRASIFTGVAIANLVTFKIVGLSWLTWVETIAIIVIYTIISKALSIIAKNTEKEAETTKETETKGE